MATRSSTAARCWAIAGLAVGTTFMVAAAIVHDVLHFREYLHTGLCLNWNPALLWPLVVSVGVTSLIYALLIPLELHAIRAAVLGEPRMGVIGNHAALLFLFIRICGLYHVVEVANVFIALPALRMVASVLMAIASMAFMTSLRGYRQMYVQVLGAFAKTRNS